MNGINGLSDAVVFANGADFLNAPPPTLDESGSEERVGDIGVVWQRTMFLHER